MVMDVQAASRVLPVYVTRFIGRESELETLRRLLLGAVDGGDQSASAAEGQRLLTLVGPGGCGKTRLAVEVAR